MTEAIEKNRGDNRSEFEDDASAVEALVQAKNRVTNELKKRIIGQEEVIELLLTSLFAKGHCIFIGVPGLAKTLLINSLAEVLQLNFNRIQFTPDLMPSDITGTDVLEADQATGARSFRFIQGPIFSNVLLADEINRTPPKTQAALLQAMQEREVTASGKTYPLAPPFLVMATQNPVEQEGTYPLPEAQLDRFMFSVHIQYPDYEDEVEIVRRTTSAHQETLNAVLSPEEILAFQELVLRVPVSDHALKYAVRLVQSSRPNQGDGLPYIEEYVGWGAGPRASQTLILGAKARAVLDGRFAVSIDDIKAIAHNVLRHRLVLNFHAEAERIHSGQVVDELLRLVPENEA